MSEGGQVQVSVDGVPWVIKPGDYMSSFSFLRTSVSTKVLLSDKVLTLGGWGGVKDFKYTDKRFEICRQKIKLNVWP